MQVQVTLYSCSTTEQSKYCNIWYLVLIAWCSAWLKFQDSSKLHVAAIHLNHVTHTCTAFSSVLWGMCFHLGSACSRITSWCVTHWQRKEKHCLLIWEAAFLSQVRLLISMCWKMYTNGMWTNRHHVSEIWPDTQNTPVTAPPNQDWAIYWYFI